MKLKRRTVMDSLPILEKLKKQNLNIKTAFKIVKVSKIISNEVEALRETFQMDSEMRNYETERLELLKKYAKLDENGNLIVRGNTVELDASRLLELEEEMKKLNEAHPGINEKIQTYYNDLNDLLDQEIDLDIETISLDDLKDVSIAPSDLDVISFLIQE